MRETRLTRRARAAIAHDLRAGYQLFWHPEPFALRTIWPNGWRMVWHDEYEVTQPVTERMREILKADDPSLEPLRPAPVTAASA
jgi:hypothetical protein